MPHDDTTCTLFLDDLGIQIDEEATVQIGFAPVIRSEPVQAYRDMLRAWRLRCES